MRNKLVFILAIIFGLLTALLVLNYLNDVKKTIDDTDYVEIIVANQDIPEKRVITANMLTTKKIPFQYMHSQEVTDEKELLGKIILVPIISGQSILKNQVINQDDAKEGLAYIVPKGKRALTVAVDEISGVAGLIKPGDRVDVISTLTIGEERPKPYTLMVLENIEILATGRVLEHDADTTKPSEVKSLTLAVTTEEAKPLMMASQRGVIRIMLRSPIDDSRGNTKPFTMEDFLNR